MPTKETTLKKTRKPSRLRTSVPKRKRSKLSTTVDAENFTFLETMVSRGRTESIAEAVDMAIARLRRSENRARLEAATARYFDGLSEKAHAEESELAHHLHLSSRGVDFDLEP